MGELPLYSFDLEHNVTAPKSLEFTERPSQPNFDVIETGLAARLIESDNQRSLRVYALSCHVTSVESRRMLDTISAQRKGATVGVWRLRRYHSLIHITSSRLIWPSCLQVCLRPNISSGSWNSAKGVLAEGHRQRHWRYSRFSSRMGARAGAITSCPWN